MHGLPTIGTIGLGWFEVSGRSRVPSPPAITTAFTRRSSSEPPVVPAQRTARRRPAASPSAIQKSHSGHTVSWPTTIRNPSEQ